MVSIDTGFIAILVTVLCCHGIEVDQDKRKEKAAAKKAEAKLKKAFKVQRKREAKAQKEEEISVAKYRRRPATPADFDPLPRDPYDLEAESRRRFTPRPVSVYLERYPQYDTSRRSE